MLSASARGISRWALAHTPGHTSQIVRAGVDGWGSVTAGLRMLPNLIIIGAQRSGTTTLYRLLSEHPAVVRPTASKGIGYFDLNYHRGDRWYRGHFPISKLADRQVPGGAAVTFESSGYYSYHPLAVQRLAADLPDVKVLMMLRDPVDRAYSAHRHEFRRGFERESFERALELEPQRLKGESERLRGNPGYVSYAHRHHSYLGRSRYSEQVANILAEIGRDRLYLIDADRFFLRPHEEFAAVQRWLELPRWRADTVPVWNAQPREPLAKDLRNRLMEYFEPYDRELEQIAGIEVSWRR